MRIAQIELKAFGHFTQQRLTFAGGAGFHLICGPNEAGKTTLWRAINCALFGIPEKTPDAHLHDYPKLRVGLSLSSSQGETLAVMRRKGRVNTLLEYDPASGSELSSSVPEERLREWLGGLSQGLFLAMFSLDHEALVRGGAALAQGRGDAGESLFEAGAGLSSIRALRSQLARETDNLFKPKASTTAIYRALAEYETTRKAAKDAAVPPREWSAARTAFEAASQDYQASRSEQGDLQKEARRLERLGAILPEVANLARAQQQLAQLAGVPILPPSAASQRIAAVTGRDAALAAERAATQRLQQHQAELAQIEVNAALLADGEAIEALHHKTTAYREATLQAAKAEAAIEQAEGELAHLARQVGCEADGTTRADDPLHWLPAPTGVARIRALGSEGATLKARQQASAETLAGKELAIGELDAAIALLGNDDRPDELAAYLNSIADHGDPEARAQQLEDEAAAEEAKLEGEARSLSMTSASALAATSLPLAGEVSLLKTEDEELRSRVRSLREESERIEDDLAALQGEIAGLTLRGEVPTRAAVAGERERRDRMWVAIRKHFMPQPGAAASTPPAPAESYELAVASADAAADELFADAERATRYAGFRVREAQMRSGLARAGERAAALGEQQAQLERRWGELLAAHRLPLLKISAAEQWFARRDAWLQKFAASRSKRQEASQRRQLAQEIRARLGEIHRLLQLPAPAASERLSETLSRSRAIARRHAEQLTQRQVKLIDRAKAAAALLQATNAAAQSSSELAAWQARWAQAMQSIRLASDASREEADARLQQAVDLAAAQASLERARSERRHAQIQIEDYQASLATLWQRVRGAALPAEGVRHELLAAELYRELTTTRTQQAKRNTLAQQIADDQQAIAEARQAGAQAAASLDQLMQQAGCSTLEALELSEGQSALAAALQEEIRAIETRLVKSAGVPLAEALAQAAGQDPDVVAAALAANQLANSENADQVQQRHAALLAAQQAFEKMDGSAAAADAQQRTAEIAARIGELGADYAASRIAAAVLGEVIETYQKRNQGPLIEKASRRFAAITGGRYHGVVIDYDEDRQILKAARADGERLAMDQLSTGRRDQLFLALRLAAIDGHLDHGEPLPVIVDDLLIQFDDEAAAATFVLLAELAQRTQVLFLTHHQHLLEVADAAIGSAAYQAHQLAR